MIKLFFGLFLSIFLTCNATFAEQKDIKELLSNTFKNIKVDSVFFRPELDMYEVVIEGNIFYVTSNMKYVIMGAIFDVSDASKPVNITAQRQAEINRQQLSILNKEYALKIGDGPVEIIEISSPRCEYCKRLARYMADKESKVTRYVFLVGVDNDPLVNYILCQPNNDSRVKAYKEIYLNNKSVTSAKNCAYASNHTEIVKRLNILGVPVLYINNNIIRGANIELIEGMINSELSKINKNKEVQKR